MIENDYEFACPHCGVNLSVRLDVTGGPKLGFTQDCETCCRPIKIRIEFEADDVVSFSAEPED